MENLRVSERIKPGTLGVGSAHAACLLSPSTGLRIVTTDCTERARESQPVSGRGRIVSDLVSLSRVECTLPRSQGTDCSLCFVLLGTDLS